MHFFISAGEPSGDLHGANLIRHLRQHDPNVRISGFGGEKMEAAGAQLLFPLTKLAVMWFLRALLNIFTFIRLVGQAKRFFKEERPDAVILIDFPGFHFALAKRAHKLGIPVYYFVPPQLWAWAGWRVKKMRKWVNTVLTALPFENDWYRQRGVNTVYIGHPFFDEVLHQQLDTEFLVEHRHRDGKPIAILPGSRMQEVHKNLPEMLRAASLIHAAEPDTRFLVASFNEAQAEVARKMIVGLDLPIQVHARRTPEIVELAQMCISVSGSVSLELMYRLKPTVIVYRLNPFSLRVGRLFIRCKFITLVNLLADKELFPEFLCGSDPSKGVSEKILGWLQNPESARQLREQLRQLREKVAIPGACERVAEFLMARHGSDKLEQERTAA